MRRKPCTRFLGFAGCGHLLPNKERVRHKATHPYGVADTERPSENSFGCAETALSDGLLACCGLIQRTVFARVVFADAFGQFGLGVHHKRAVGGDWLINRQAGEQQQFGGAAAGVADADFTGFALEHGKLGWA